MQRTELTAAGTKDLGPPLEGTPHQKAEWLADKAVAHGGRLGAYVAGVVLATRRPPNSKREMHEIFAAAEADVPADQMAERLLRRDRAVEARVQALKSAAKPAPTRAVVERPGLRLAGEGAAVVARERLLASQPAGVLCLHPDAVGETNEVIVFDGRTGLIEGIERRPR